MVAQGAHEVSDAALKLFWCPQTRASRIAWMLEELGRPYERVLVDVRDPERDDPEEFRRASPLGKVPAIADGGVGLAESAAICLYLADRYALGDLAPELDSPDRARYLFWTLYTPSVVEPAMSERFVQSEPNPMSNSWGDFDRMVGALEQGMEGREWIAADRFTAADVMLGSSVLFLRMFEALPASASLEAYADRCAARPAYARAMAFDEEAG